MTHTDGILFISLVFLASVGAFAFWVWMLVDCFRNRRLSSNERMAWLVAIFFTGIVGAVIYHEFRRHLRGRLLPHRER